MVSETVSRSVINLDKSVIGGLAYSLLHVVVCDGRHDTVHTAHTHEGVLCQVGAVAFFLAGDAAGGQVCP